MADAVKFQTLERFAGVNNLDDAARLFPVVVDREYVFPLQRVDNLDIDNTYQVAVRSGYDSVLSGSDIHSLWSDGDVCLYIDGDVLYQLHTDYTKTPTRTVTPSKRVSYTTWNNRAYFTNNHEIGYVEGDIGYDLVDPQLEFKTPLPAGKFIDYYRGRLYVAKGPILYISDVLCDYFDLRTGYIIMPTDITMLRAVDSGLYVADTEVHWFKGDIPEEFDHNPVYGHPPIPYTDVAIDGQHVGDGLEDRVAIWTSHDGICMGDGSGKVTNLTDKRYVLSPTGQGAAFIREANLVRHYINSLY